MDTKLFLERNMARDAVIFSPLKAPEKGKAELPDGQTIDVLGWKDKSRSFFVPVLLTDVLREMKSLTRCVYAAVVTLFLERPEILGPAREPKAGVVKTSLREICRRLGLSAGKNLNRIAASLTTLEMWHVRNYEMVTVDGKGKLKEKHQLELFTLLAYVKFAWETDEEHRCRKALIKLPTDTGKEFEEMKRRFMPRRPPRLALGSESVEIHIPPPVARALLSDTPKARIPLAVLVEARKKPRLEEAILNVAFYLAGADPGRKKNHTVHLKHEFLFKLTRLKKERPRRDRERVEKILTLLKHAGVVGSWSLEKGVYHICLHAEEDSCQQENKDS